MVFVYRTSAVLSLPHFFKTKKLNPEVTQVQIIGFQLLDNTEYPYTASGLFMKKTQNEPKSSKKTLPKPGRVLGYVSALVTLE